MELPTLVCIRERLVALSSSYSAACTSAWREAIPVDTDLDEQAGGHGVVERSQETVVIDIHEGVDDRDVELGADHRGEREHGAGRRSQAADAAPNDLACARGNTELRRGNIADPTTVTFDERPRFDKVSEHLVDEEGISCRVHVDSARERGARFVELVAREPDHECADTRFIEAPQVDTLHIGRAPQIGEEVRGAHSVGASSELR